MKTYGHVRERSMDVRTIVSFTCLFIVFTRLLVIRIAARRQM